MGWLDAIKVTGQFSLLAVVLAFVYFCIMGLVIYIQGQTAPDWWPDWIAKIFEKVDNTKKYKFMSNVYSPGSNILSTFSNSTVTQCMTECSNIAACIAITLNPLSNTCSMLSNVSYPIPFTGNNFYVLSTLVPSKMYSSYTSNTVDSYTTTTIPSLTVSTYLDCASNCSSNVSCTGFVYNSTTNMCQTYNNIKTSNLTTTTINFTSYILSASTFVDI